MSAFPAVRGVLAGALGGLAAAGYAVETGLAFNAFSRAWEMGAIPLLLASVFFPGVLAGVVAALVSPSRCYVAALLAAAVLFAISLTVHEFREELTAAMTQDERREFWANIDAILFAAFPLSFLCALSGALMVDPAPSERLRRLRDGIRGPLGLLAFVALIPISVLWLPPLIGLAFAAAAPTVFFLVQKRGTL